MTPRPPSLEESYNRVAAEYASRFFDELRHKPLDRALLACFADEVRGKGRVADLGCGPGQIARHLRESGVSALGIDLSPEMVTLARRLTPEVEFRAGSMLALDAEPASWAGITAFYAIVHLTPQELPIAFAELYRVLAPGGLVLLSFHLGRERIHLETWFDQAVDLDFYLFEWPQVEGALEGAGFTIEARIERAPYVEVEHPTRRAYLLARRPLAPGT